jgi:two-component system, NtrC family, C4-dicarboxylate transport sensor histidine kinase DctB
MAEALPTPSSASLWGGRWLFAGLLLVAIFVPAFVGSALFSARAEREVFSQAEAETTFRAAILSRHLQQFRDIPKILAQDRDVQRAVSLRPTDRQAIALSAKLESLIAQTEVEAIYLIGKDGVARAASNWRAERNFVGQDYNFRPYFKQALESGNYEFFALGTVSATAGLYIAQRVVGADGAGVVVAKVNLSSIETEWSRSPGRVAVIDSRGIIVLASDSNWRFGHTRPLTMQQRIEIQQTRQFGDDPALPRIELPKTGDATGLEIAVGRPVERSNWTLISHSSTAPIRLARIIGFVLGALCAALLAVIILALNSRRRRAQAQRIREAMTRFELEHRVAERTHDLNEANAQLTTEISERKRVEIHSQLLQDELIQANRLAIVGQVSAGVAHEVNQPLAAIRTFAESAVTFLDRSEPEEARANLTSIAELSVRIATITDALRAMSRKSTAPQEPVAVTHAIEGALLLISARARDILIEQRQAPNPLQVLAHRMRLEQVLLNLLQNALDACAATDQPKIIIATRKVGSDVQIDIMDNGAGIAPEAVHALFTPFSTTKPEGLGLGLAISLEICREYGGNLESVPSPLGGAAFRITLPALS